jgi:YcxB-like protein
MIEGDYEFASGHPPVRPRVPIAFISNSSAYFVEASRRLKRVQGRNLSRAVLLLVICVFTIVAIALFSSGGIKEALPLLATYGVFIVLLPLFKSWSDRNILRAFKKSSLYECEHTIEFSDSGVRFNSRVEDTLLRWPFFKKVVHFNDGFLIFREGNLANWIPKSSFAEQSLWDETQVLIEAMIEEHTYVNFGSTNSIQSKILGKTTERPRISENQ